MSGCTAIPTTAELAREVIMRVAPDELVAFEVVAAPYLDDPRRAERRLLNGADDALGAALGDALAVLTPVVTLICGSVTTALAQGAAEEVRSRGTKITGRLLDRLGGRRSRPAETVSAGAGWSTEELAGVRQIALERARALGMKPRRAEALADAVVGALALRRE